MLCGAIYEMQKATVLLGKMTWEERFALLALPHFELLVWFGPYFTSFWEDFGTDLGVLGGIVAPWRPLGEGLERFKRQQGATKAPWGDFGAPWKGFGEYLIANWAHLGCVVRPWEALGCVLEASWEVFWVFWMGCIRDALFRDVFLNIFIDCLCF